MVREVLQEWQAPGIGKRTSVRAIASLCSNAVRGCLSFLTALLIARGLGPAEFGNFTFLLASFVAVGQVLEMGTSSAFYTFLSQHRRGRNFFLLYFAWVGFQLVVQLVATGLIMPRLMLEGIWIGQARDTVVLACLASFVSNQMWGVMTQMGEAERRTVLTQSASLLQALVHCVLVAALLVKGRLSVRTVFVLLVTEYSVALVLLGRKLTNMTMREDARRESIRAVGREFAWYCRPLVLYGFVSFFYTLADRWLLQRYGGAVQQGFFSVGQQIANISMIATVSILRVFWKEVAEARACHDATRVRMLYETISRGLYVVSAWVSCLVFPYTSEILRMSLGRSYGGARLALVIMLAYPIHQSLGQIQTTFLCATSETAIYARIGLSMMVVSVPVTYLVLAPPTAVVPGLGLGAVGLATKLVVLQLLQVTWQGVVIARKNAWGFGAAYQVLVVLALAILAWACTTICGGRMGMGMSFYAIASIACLHVSGWAGTRRCYRQSAIRPPSAQQRVPCNDV